MSSPAVQRHKSSAKNSRLLPAINRLLAAGMKLGSAGKRNAINKVLELVPEWTRGDCWRRLRQLRRLPEFAPASAASVTAAESAEAEMRHRGATRAWTTDDDDRLLNWAGYEPVKKIALRLGRSEHAVRFRMAALGMSAKVTDGWSLRSLRKLLRVSPKRIRFLIGSGQLRVRDCRVTAASFANFFESQRASLDSGADARFAAAWEKCEEGYSWERAAAILGLAVECIQNLICAGTLKVVDPFVTHLQRSSIRRPSRRRIAGNLTGFHVPEIGVAGNLLPALAGANRQCVLLRARRNGAVAAGLGNAVLVHQPFRGSRIEQR